MTYLALYVAGIAFIWWVFRDGWAEPLKTILSVLIPLALIILFNARAGRLLFRNPIVGIISVLPTAVFIFKASQPIVVGINSWIDKKNIDFVEMKDVVDAEVISKEEA
ncbi:hypothetical protein [Prochlorococcus sp. MIT 1307]|uniref:hypothetical protein n=1 Tax=Prochlorococcus sp. MIT 1307 TaxID=3096219 RepID=UPI002A75BC52|nr:hypothetical protein [Prochlorococcus sp. MIT 1307]